MNFGRVRALAVKESLQVARDPRSLIIVLLMPILQMLLLGYGLNLDVKHIPTCTFDREGSQSSRDMLDRFHASQYFDVQQPLHTYPDLTAAIDAGTCRLAVVVPPDFTKRLNGLGGASVQVIVDAVDSNQANIAMGYARSVVAEFANDLQVQALGRQGMTVPVRPVALEPRVWFNEDLESRNFIIPGVVALVLALIGAQLTSLTISREWERGTMELLISTPVTPMEVLVGKLAPYFVVGLLDATICISFATLWFHVPFRGTLGALFVTTSLFLIVVLGIGYLFSVAIKSQIGASQIALIVTMLPTVLLSGMTFPIDQMPAPVQLITYLVSGRYYVTIVKAIFLKGSALTDLIGPMAALTAYATIVALLASRAFRKRLE
jgi:ABC-2 type transport system permease protein